MKIKIKEIKQKLPLGYVGMNKYAYQSLYHKKYPYPTKTILVYKGLGKRAKEHTIRHEKIEMELMKNKRYSYRKAHKFALEFEK